jgi:GNAT superfamily N-acetyltransferase
LYDSASVCVVAETAEGVIVGCGTAKVVRRDVGAGLEREGQILTLAVDPAWRRRGIGRDLLEVSILYTLFSELWYIDDVIGFGDADSDCVCETVDTDRTESSTQIGRVTDQCTESGCSQVL